MTRLERITFAVFTGLFLISLGGESWGKDVQFVAREFSGDQSVWLTDSQLLERLDAETEELVFVLENPTNVEHAFVVPGVQMITREEVLTPESTVDITEPMRIAYAEPLSVTVKPGESKRLRVQATELFSPKSTGVAFRYFCTIHKDLHQAGSLFVM